MRHEDHTTSVSFPRKPTTLLSDKKLAQVVNCESISITVCSRAVRNVTDVCTRFLRAACPGESVYIQ